VGFLAAAKRRPPRIAVVSFQYVIHRNETGVHEVNENERILLATAVEQGGVVVGDILKRYGDLNEQKVVSLAESLVGQGLLEKAEPGTYRATELGRSTWNSFRESALRVERNEVVRRNRTWGRAA
jgi:hypothetical protein